MRHNLLDVWFFGQHSALSHQRRGGSEGTVIVEDVLLGAALLR